MSYQKVKDMMGDRTVARVSKNVVCKGLRQDCFSFFAKDAFFLSVSPADSYLSVPEDCFCESEVENVFRQYVPAYIEVRNGTGWGCVKHKGCKTARLLNITNGCYIEGPDGSVPTKDEVEEALRRQSEAYMRDLGRRGRDEDSFGPA